MSRSPRLAVGGLHAQADIRPVIWGLLDYLDRFGVSVQPFFYQARLDAVPFAEPIRGLPYRHLDSWLMTPSACRRELRDGSKGRDWSLVEGLFATEKSQHTGDANSGGRLETLCEWLGLGALGVIDVDSMPPVDRIARPDRLHGILLMNVRDDSHARRMDSELRRMWRVPVLGWIPQTPALMGMVDQLPRTRKPSRQLCREFGARLGETLDVLRLFEATDSQEGVSTKDTNRGDTHVDLKSLSDSKTFDFRGIDFRSGDSKAGDSRTGDARSGDSKADSKSGEFKFGDLKPADLKSLRIAFAMDEAFDRHFAGTWDLLREAGVQVTDFSPLRSEAIPPRTSLVVFGDGEIAPFAARLSQNHCLKQSLTQFVASGGAVFSQGAGTAWLCRDLLVDDRKTPMADVLPFSARFERGRSRGPARPAKVAWLGGADAGAGFQGYETGAWRFDDIASNGSLSDSHYRKNADRASLRRVYASPIALNWICHPALLQLAAGVRIPTV